ncbi:DUF6858 family protein [Marinospirillum insulare]|uniref:Uncharacterized protein n=1 Tax=Marinospirillum insulare TaxID=217169 RepID=A0ABQ5ZVE1_9GAMM|nr:hypothetical protein [Marinospirillum insulare]GLR63416.1 hypothetical protein GCM10007878_08510 [Marinospirillum insulare]
MQFTNFLDKYPTHQVEILKANTAFKNVDDFLNFFSEKVDSNPLAMKIAEFDHYAHTSSLPEGEIAENILAAKQIIFCFGIKLPSPTAMAPRPRSIGITEHPDHFTIVFMEAPNPAMHKTMLEWVAELQN